MKRGVIDLSLVFDTKIDEPFAQMRRVYPFGDAGVARISDQDRQAEVMQ